MNPNEEQLEAARSAEQQANDADSAAFQNAVDEVRERTQIAPIRMYDSAGSDLLNRFMHHPAKPGQPERYSRIRSAGLMLAELIEKETQESPEQTLAIRKVEEAVFWANAAIARNE